MYSTHVNSIKLTCLQPGLKSSIKHGIMYMCSAIVRCLFQKAELAIVPQCAMYLWWLYIYMCSMCVCTVQQKILPGNLVWYTDEFYLIQDVIVLSPTSAIKDECITSMYTPSYLLCVETEGTLMANNALIPVPQPPHSNLPCYRPHAHKVRTTPMIGI